MLQIEISKVGTLEKMDHVFVQHNYAFLYVTILNV